MSPAVDMSRPLSNSQSTPPPSPSAPAISNSNTLEIENVETAFAAWLVTAVKKFMENKLSGNRPASTENPEVKGEKPHASRATTLAYKHVKETRIDFLPAYPLRYHHNYDEIFRELVKNGRRFISLHGSHHLKYQGFAFSFDDEGEIVKRHVNERIMVDPVGFREHNPGHPQPTVRNVSPIQETPGPSNWTGSFSSETVVLQDEDFLICGPTVLGFCLVGKKFLEFAVAQISDITWMPSPYDDVKIPGAQKKAI
ncbi:hypothetical protein H9Q74_006290 [Fusarium xylarioides]|nr:hypothetical protein H9Q71_009031 [Fusarium xylarioides]KAG5823606.1 hypothetical protein H9Q74_006290 [Fusarium xylarioides]